LEKEGIKVAKNFKDSPAILINIGQIQQVFLNVMVNAKEAMSQGGTLAINIYPEENHIVIEIADTGPGIEEELLSRIFEPFFTMKKGGAGGRRQGTGLGLPISLNIVEKHDGIMTVKSKKGLGSCFIIRLPINHSELKGATDGRAFKDTCSRR